MKMAKRKKKYSQRSSMDKSLDKSLKGFWIRFELEDPLGSHGEPCQVQVGSNNPVVRLRLRNDAFWSAMRKVLHVRRLKWRISLEMDFVKDGKTDTKFRDIVGVSALPDLDDVYQDTLVEMFKDATDKNYIDDYRITRVSQEVLSGQEIKDCDFT
jgi:hypothetical protein